MITRMAKVEIVGPKRHLLPSVDALHRYGRIHISATRFTQLAEFAEVEKQDLDTETTRYKSRLEALSRKVDEVLALLAETPGVLSPGAPAAAPAPELSEETIDEHLKASDDLQTRIKGLVRKKLDLQEELSFVQKYERVIEAFGPMLEQLGTSKNLDLIGFTLRKKKGEVLDLLRQELEDLTAGRSEVFTRDLDENTLAGVVAVPRELHRAVRRLFVSENVSELRLPESLGQKSPLETLAFLRRRLEEIPAEISAVDEQVGLLSSGDYRETFRHLSLAIQDRLSQVIAMGQAARTKMTFVLTGWLPRRHLEDFLAYARKTLDPSVVVTPCIVGHEDLESGDIPVCIENPPLIRPFELCLKLIPRPNYGSIDPTPFVALFFPVFFGLILGDVAYGLLLVALAAFIHYRFRPYALAQSASVVLFACATSTILFGILFGEFLGDLGMKWGIMKPIFLNRETAIVPTLVLAVGLGTAHIFLGILIKAWNSVRWRHWGHAVEALSTVLIVVALILLVAALAGFLPPAFKQVGIWALVVLLPVLVVSGGVIALLEIFGVFGSILSYARIMAIGLSSVILAMVANRLAGEFGNLILGILIAALIHLINLVLGVFGPTVHSLRLHYVEFFGKFYTTGSVNYRPLTRKSREPNPAPEGGS